MADLVSLSHYDSAGLSGRLMAALTASGLTRRSLSPGDLAPLDQFHTRGLAATMDLIAAAAITATDTVLDVGSGLGGPSRTLAATVGCQVVGIDITLSFVEAAAMLSALCGLANRTKYLCGNALSLPFPDASFDVAWSQHVAMNIEDRPRLYGEIRRVLRPGGRFAVYDVVTGSGEPLHFPVPWSTGPATSFLLDAETMRASLEQQGFRVLQWLDRTEEGIAWVQQQRLPRAGIEPKSQSLGLHLAMGPSFPEMSANLGRNLMEGRIRLQQAILATPNGPPG